MPAPASDPVEQSAHPVTAPDAPRSLADKFRSAFRGLGQALCEEFNFRLHGLAAVAVLAAGALLGLALEEWCLLVLCIAGVFAAELLNTALERLARSITREYRADIRDALDMASAAVLAAACGAAIVGALVLGRRCGIALGWW